MAQGEETLVLATTTSTENSGLLEKLLPPFEEKFRVRVRVVAVGSGAALKLGERGDADVLLVHAPEAEEAFVAAGHGVNRRGFMYNDFVLVGPQTDPAGIKGVTEVVKALFRVGEKGALFVSRGDDSGTDQKEKSLWREAGVTGFGPWYKEIGRGMAETLTVADEMRAYTLSDRATYLALGSKIALAVLVEGDARLRNPYSVIAVNPARHPDANYLGAMQLIAWVTSPAGQTIIADYQPSGQPMFVPTAVPAYP